MPIRHELKSHRSPNAFQSLHWSGKLGNSRTMEHTLLSWERCFTSMGVGNGITTSSLFRRGCRGRKSDGGSRANTAHVTTFVESEDEVGSQLLTRRARGIELTAAGRAFLEHARSVLSQVEAAIEAARRVAHPVKPCFSMGFLTGHELTWMPEALRILRDELPNIDVMISSQ
jgi:hypothetical protein